MDRSAVASPAVERIVAIGLRVGRPGSVSALVAVVTVLAVELLRVFPSQLSWQPGMRELGQVAWSAGFAAPFVAAGLAVVVAARRDARWILLVGGLALAVTRVALQVSGGEERVVFAALGLASALTVLSILATLGLPLFGGGVAAGIAVDAALQVVFATRPLSWVHSTGATVVVAVLVVWLVGLVWHRSRREVFVLGRSLRSAVPLLLIGPALAVQAHAIGSLGWVAHVLSRGWLFAFVVVAVGTGAAVLGAAWSARVPDGRWPLVGWAGGAAALALAAAHEAPGWWWAPALVVAQAGIGVALTAAISRGVGTGATVAPATALGGGMLLVLGALTVLDGRGIVGQPVAPPVVLVLVAALVLVSVSTSRVELMPRPHRAGRREAASLLVVFLAPALLVVLVGAVAAAAVPRVGGAPGELRVVTYNVALAFDPAGRLNLVGVGETLAALDADVVALQEVPRGQLPAGGVDMLGYLGQRLGMRYSVFQPAAPGAMHGNAVLSRHPIGAVDQRSFSRSGTALPRGALAAFVELPGTEPVLVIAAHLPPGGSPSERAHRVEAMLDLWNGRSRTVVAADLNTQPGSSIVAGLEDGGLRSAWNVDWGPGYTYPAAEPRSRIDWILHSADLSTSSAEIPVSTASDHLPLVATIELG